MVVSESKPFGYLQSQTDDQSIEIPALQPSGRLRGIYHFLIASIPQKPRILPRTLTLRREPA